MNKLFSLLTSFFGILGTLFYKKKYDLEKEKVNNLKIMWEQTNEALKFKKDSKIVDESSADDYLNRVRLSRENGGK